MRARAGPDRGNGGTAGPGISSIQAYGWRKGASSKVISEISPTNVYQQSERKLGGERFGSDPISRLEVNSEKFDPDSIFVPAIFPRS